MKVQGRLWKELMQFPIYMVGMLAFALITAVSIIYQSKWTSIIVDRAVFENTTIDALLPVFKTLIVFIVLRGMLQFLFQWTANQAGSRIIHRMRVNSLESLLPVIAERRGDLSSGRISTLFTDKPDAIKQYYSQYIAQMMLSALIPITVLVFIFPLDWVSGLVFILTAPLIPFFMALIGSQSKKATEYRWGYLSRLADHFADHIRGMEVLKQFNQAKQRLDDIERVSKRYATLTMDILKITFLSALALELLTTLSTAVVAVEIGLRLLHSGIDFQTAFFILLIAPEFYLPLRMLGLKFHAGMTGQTAAIEFFELFSEVMQEPGSGITKDIEPSDGISVSFENVSFQYVDGKNEVLHDISFNCPPGTLTALIGKSGSGKSTIAKLALRFIEPEQGNVLMNGIPAVEISTSQWYAQIAWLGQKSFYAEGAILDNLRFANRDADENRIVDALTRVGLNKKVESLPDGLATSIAEFGQNFSGGEVQRLQIARALISDAPLLILDEPTSQLDPDLEALFIAELENIRKHKTVLLIAHRLQTVMHADNILFLEDGHIIEQGTHERLLQQAGRYLQMTQLYQAGGGV